MEADVRVRGYPGTDLGWSGRQVVAERLATEAGLDETKELHAPWAKLLERHMNAVVQGEAPWKPHRQFVSDSAREAMTSAGGAPSSAALAPVASLDCEYPAWSDVAPATAALRRNRLVIKSAARWRNQLYLTSAKS